MIIFVYLVVAAAVACFASMAVYDLFVENEDENND